MNRTNLKNIFIIMISLIILVPHVNANLGTFKQNSCVPIRVLANCSDINLTEVTINQEISIAINLPMTKLGGQTFNYSFCNTSTNGEYTYSWNNPCVDCGQGDCGNNFDITPNGSKFSIQQALVFIILFILFLLFLVGGVYGMSNSVNGAWTIGYICLVWISLFCIFFVSWLFSVNYLWATPILASIFWILWFVMGVGFLPFIIILSLYIIGKGIKENLEKEYIKQGYSNEEAKEMAKRRKR